MKVLSITILLLLGISCSGNSAKQITADILLTALSTAIVTSLTCEAKDVVANDVKTEVYKWFNLQTKGLAQDLCKSAVTEILPALLGSTMNTVKPTWQCKLTTLNNAVEIISTLACNNIK